MTSSDKHDEPSLAPERFRNATDTQKSGMFEWLRSQALKPSNPDWFYAGLAMHEISRLHAASSATRLPEALAELESTIDDAPHAEYCGAPSSGGAEVYPCRCWKNNADRILDALKNAAPQSPIAEGVSSAGTAVAAPDFNTEQNLHADTVAERFDSAQEDVNAARQPMAWAVEAEYEQAGITVQSRQFFEDQGAAEYYQRSNGGKLVPLYAAASHVEKHVFVVDVTKCAKCGGDAKDERHYHSIDEIPSATEQSKE